MAKLEQSNAKQKMSAQALVEFALVIPILLLVIYGLLEAGRLIFLEATVVSAAREGARFGSATGTMGGTYQYKNCAGIRAAAKKVDALGAITDAHILIQYDRNGDGNFNRVCSAGVALNSGDRIRVTVQAEFIPFIGNLPLVSRRFTNLPPNPLSSYNTRTVLGEVEVKGAMVGLPLGLSIYIDGVGTVTSADGQINCSTDPAHPATDCDATYQSGDSVTLIADDDPYKLDAWGSGACADALDDPTCTFTITDDEVVMASFTSHRLSVSKVLIGSANGKVTSYPAGINCDPDCVADYENKPVTLVADPIGSYRFLGWGLDCGGFRPDENCVLQMNKDHPVSVTFGPEGTLVILTINSGVGSGGRVISTDGVGGPPNGILDCTESCAASFPPGTVVTLEAIPFPGSDFKGWSIPGCFAATSCGFWLTGDTSVTATFDTSEKVLQVSKTGTGADTGLVTSIPPGINCGLACSYSYPTDTPVILTASAPTGINFTGWSGACTGTEPTCSVTMKDIQSVTANFDDILEKTLVVTKIGEGDGMVRSSSDPAGLPYPLACGSICSATFPNNTVVTLTAEPDVNSTFEGWGGACSYAGTNTTCTVTMSVARTVTVQFDPIVLAPCRFVNDRIYWENSVKTVTWVFSNISPPPTNIEVDYLTILYDGSNLQKVTLDGKIIWTGESFPSGTIISDRGQFLAAGNHIMIFQFQAPNDIQNKNFSTTVHLVPEQCKYPPNNFPAISWTVK